MTRIRDKPYFDKQLKAMAKKGNINLIVQVVPMWVAPEDRRFEEGIFDYLVKAGAHAMGADKTTSVSECFCCLGEWTINRHLLGFVTMEFISQDRQSMGSVAGICEQCWGSRKKLFKAVERDFGIKQNQTRQIMPEGGHA